MNRHLGRNRAWVFRASWAETLRRPPNAPFSPYVRRGWTGILSLQKSSRKI